MQFLLGYFGEVMVEPCGRCDQCEAGTAARFEPARSPFPLGAAVEHVEFGRGSVSDVADGKVTVLFEEVGYRTLDPEIVKERALLRQV
jgi:ATP-dependent DNA helicase RecQ